MHQGRYSPQKMLRIGSHKKLPLSKNENSSNKNTTHYGCGTTCFLTVKRERKHAKTHKKQLGNDACH